MEPINRYSLEDYAERHRADFDLHEPRPELWAQLEKQLDATSAPDNPAPMMSVVKDEQPARLPQPTPTPTLRPRSSRHWQTYGIAAGLAALIAAAGLGEAWKTSHRPVADNQASSIASYLGPQSTALAASEGGPDVDARLDTAVHGMERYYLAQLSSRKEQLSQLAPATIGEWTRELVGLDSSYQQLKRELPRHPQPEVVLTAMNRNLQIRLDILDQQLELHGADQAVVAAADASSEYVLADSRAAADNPVQQTNAH